MKSAQSAAILTCQLKPWHLGGSHTWRGVKMSDRQQTSEKSVEAVQLSSSTESDNEALINIEGNRSP